MMTLAEADVVTRINETGGLCELWGFPYVFKTGAQWQMSIDRLDNSKDYSPDNFRLVILETNGPAKWTKALVDEIYVIWELKLSAAISHEVEIFVDGVISDVVTDLL